MGKIMKIKLNKSMKDERVQVPVLVLILLVVGGLIVGLPIW